MSSPLSFAQQFKSFCKQVDEKTEDVPPVSIRYYNIHKQSMPVGVDIPVMFNLTYDEAKAVSNFKVTQKESGVHVYYAIVNQEI